MGMQFKKVPALEKCFNILELLSKNKNGLGISEISNALGYNKSTVYNIAYTLCDLCILEAMPGNKFCLGVQLYALGKSAGTDSELIQTVHPYLDKINKKLNLSAFLGILVGKQVVTVDKVDSPVHLKVSSSIGGSTPILAGAVAKVILSKMSDSRIDEILSKNELVPFTKYSCTDKNEYRKMIEKARMDGYAFSNEEYIEGIRALAVPLDRYRENIDAAIYVVGLSIQIKDEDIYAFSEILKRIAFEINTRMSLT
ncbi:MAG TPA: IclR family transcriptional regulator [Desulfobacteraceae bacterium]|nr:IclR family transcriptional regulator [Desulfobacteraceae bacterium]HPJ67787.1 IclR family transcriptional regulator [Desulfobacteraceae bacterium]HPQ28054.1 IclR family transcriptional regulator [Desulfobacteraceae bacterium]